MRKYIENRFKADFDVICDSFIHDGVLDQYAMPIITIYKNTTKDYPGKYVARIFDIKPGEVDKTRYIMLSDSLNKIRAEIPKHMSRFMPQDNEDPVILETWI